MDSARFSIRDLVQPVTLKMEEGALPLPVKFRMEC